MIESSLHSIIGLVTLGVSAIGMYITGRHYLFFSKSKDKLGKTVSKLFLSDCLIYFLTLLFGLWAMMDLGFKVALNLQIIRIPLLAFNVLAAMRLYTLTQLIRAERKSAK
mgnify:CR=1 FL=1